MCTLRYSKHLEEERILLYLKGKKTLRYKNNVIRLMYLKKYLYFSQCY
jgi:hypothetical protein